MPAREDVIQIANNDIDNSLIYINEDVITGLDWPEGADTLPSWDWIITDALKLDPDPTPALTFWMLAVAQAFRFWTYEPDRTISRYFFNGKSGTNAMFDALMSAWGNGKTPAHYSYILYIDLW